MLFLDDWAESRTVFTWKSHARGEEEKREHADGEDEEDLHGGSLRGRYRPSR
jgi:hypothetical protein